MTTPQSGQLSERELQRRRNKRMTYKRIAAATALPTLATGAYFLFLAPPGYQSTAEFSIEGSRQAAPDLLSSFGLAAPSTATNDAKIVTDYAMSRPIIQELRKTSGFNEAYSKGTLDPFSYLSPSAPLETAQDFWLRHSIVSYDTTTNIVTMTVTAYTPEDSLRLAQGVLKASAAVVNSIGQASRSSATDTARQELERKKADYLAAKKAVTSSRGERNQIIDAQASQEIGLVGQIDAKIAQARSDEATAAATYQPGSPQTRAVEAQIAGLNALRAQALARSVNGPGNTAAANDLSDKAALMDLEFAQKNYYTALSAMQATATQDASDRRYIVPFIKPLLPEKSDYFTRLWDVAAVALGSLLIIGTAMLTYSVVKDHTS